MKWKKWLLLGLCLALTGCGQGSGSGVPVQEPSAGGSSVQQSGGDPQAGGEVEEPVQGEGEIHQLGASAERKLSEITLENAWQRAAYLADCVYDDTNRSTLVSPLSLEMALGLVTEGASGETARELYQYLGNEKYAEFAQKYMERAQMLASSEEASSSYEGKYSFHYELANSLWVRKDDKLTDAYRKLAEEKFYAQAANVDFVNEAEETSRRINAWCDEHTHGMIPKMVDPKMFSPGLAAILMNSVYFESPWMEKWVLREHSFRDLQGNETTQEMLWDTLDVYYENEYATAFAKNYYNGFQFIGILPKKEGDFRISDLDIKGLLGSVCYDYEVKAIAPKLNFETTAENIVDILRSEGVQRAFDMGLAEFDGLVENRNLYISDILQKCKIELDEEGTRAAAVTMILCKDTAILEPVQKVVKEVYLDRPFAFLIYDSTNDQIVFVGKVTELQ